MVNVDSYKLFLKKLHSTPITEFHDPTNDIVPFGFLNISAAWLYIWERLVIARFLISCLHVKILKGVLWLKISLKTKLSATSLWPFTNDKKRECENIYSKRQNV